MKKTKVSRREFLLTMAATTTLAASQNTSKKTNGVQPNIILLLADDQRNDTLGCAGHPILQTPNIDSLAATGCYFENAFVTTSICAASRASIFTGLYERTHQYTFGTPPLQAAYIANSYPVKLRENGYKTAFIGKFGVSVLNQDHTQMFDFFQDLSGHIYFYEQPNGTLRHETEVAIDHAIDFMRDNQSDPFVISVSFNAPHADPTDFENHFPYPTTSNGLYEGVDIPPPLLSDDSVFDALPTFLKESINRDRYFWRWDTDEKYQKNMKDYFRMITGVDTAVGRVIDELEALNLDQDTIIIYMADNGYYMGSRGFAGKWSHYGESMRIPMIIRDPRVAETDKGIRPTQVALNVDIASTILEYAGIDIPNSYQGKSLLPIINNEAFIPWRDDFFSEHLMDRQDIPKWEGLRAQRYVYANYFEQQPPYEFLHDLQEDPNQLINYVDDPSYQPQLNLMRNRTQELNQLYTSQQNVIFKNDFE